MGCAKLGIGSLPRRSAGLLGLAVALSLAGCWKMQEVHAEAGDAGGGDTATGDIGSADNTGEPDTDTGYPDTDTEDAFFHPSDDAFVTQYNPLANTGDSMEMSVRNWDGGGPGDNWELAPLVRFDLSAIPEGAFIQAALLALFYFDYHDDPPDGRILSIYRFSEP